MVITAEEAKTVHELFELRKKAKTPEEKQAIQYAIHEAARGRAPGKVEAVKTYFEKKPSRITVQLRAGESYIGGVVIPPKKTKGIIPIPEKGKDIVSVLPEATYKQVYEKVEPEHIEQIKKYEQEGYKVKRTPEEFIFYKEPEKDTRMEWALKEQEKIGSAYKKSPVLGVVAEYGFGATMLFAHTAKEASRWIQWTGPRVYGVGGTVRPLWTKESIYDPLQRVHFPTVVDVIGGGPKGAREFVLKHPVFATGSIAGEVLQLYAFGKGVEPFVGATKVGIKTVVKTTPRVYAKFTKVFPTYVTETGKVVGSPMVKGIQRSVSRIGQTPFWRHAYGWSTGSLTRVKVLPEVSRISTKFPGGVHGEIVKYRGWGQVKWVPREVAKGFKVGEKMVVSHHKYISSTVGRGREQIFGVELTGKPKGMLWWKRVSTQYVSRYEFKPFVFERTGKPLIDTSGWVRPGYKPSMELQKLTESAGGEWIRAEHVYWGIKDPLKHGSKFWLSDEAYGSLVRPVQTFRPMMHGGMRGMGYITRSISIPSYTFAPIVTPIVAMGVLPVSKVVSALQYGYAPKLEVVKITKPAYETAKVSAFEFKQAQLPGQSLAQKQVQLQRQMQKQIQKTKYQLSTVSTPIISRQYRGKPFVSAYTPFPAKIHPPFYLPEGGVVKRKPKKRVGFEDWLKGYRVRTWKVPSLEQFLKGGM